MDRWAVDAALWLVAQGEDFLKFTGAANLLDKGFDHYACGVEPLIKLVRKEKNLSENADEFQLASQYLISYVCHNWRKYKAIYNFNSSFLKVLLETEDAPVYPDILKQLPYPDFTMNLPEEFEYDNMFVHVEFSDKHGTGETDTLFLITLFCENPSNGALRLNQCMHWCGNGKKLLESFRETKRTYYDHSLDDGNDGTYIANKVLPTLETPTTMEELNMYKVRNLAMEKYLRAAVTAAYYLASRNAEIKETKIKKSERPVFTMKQGKKPHKVIIRDYEVGYVIGKSFESQMEEQHSSQNILTIRGGSTHTVRPHIRRAHWHHYWVGEGRTRREVRWLQPTMVLPGPRNEPSAATIRRVHGN